MKKFISISIAAALVAFSASAQNTYFQPTTLINSTGSTNSGTAVTNGLWPRIISNASVTNVIKIAANSSREIAFQVTGNLMATNATAVNVVYQLGRSVQNVSITNAASLANLNIEWIGTLTNTIPVNSTTGTSTYNVGTATSLSQGNIAKGAIGYYYIGYVTVPAAVNYTNYSVYVNLVP